MTKISSKFAKFIYCLPIAVCQNTLFISFAQTKVGEIDPRTESLENPNFYFIKSSRWRYRHRLYNGSRTLFHDSLNHFYTDSPSQIEFTHTHIHPPTYTSPHTHTHTYTHTHTHTHNHTHTWWSFCSVIAVALLLLFRGKNVVQNNC
jgi:hypothetical protein